MLCFRDMTFCSASQGDCINTACGRYFGPDDQEAADKWWKRFKDPEQGPPIAWGDLKEGCLIYKGPKPINQHKDRT